MNARTALRVRPHTPEGPAYSAASIEHGSDCDDTLPKVMKVIQANCRVQFTAEDVEFVLATLGGHGAKSECLVKLLGDADSRDAILDDPQLFQALLERRGCLTVSGHFYFYVLVRQVLKRSGLESREVADYVAELLAEFSQSERARFTTPGGQVPLDYFFEMLAAVRQADDFTRFQLRAHIGNQSLFMSGIFLERIHERTERRGFPDVKYYEELGGANFRMASDHRLARRYHLESVFAELGESFHATRVALNDMAERLLSVGEPDHGSTAVLKHAFGAA